LRITFIFNTNHLYRNASKQKFWANYVQQTRLLVIQRPEYKKKPGAIQVFLLLAKKSISSCYCLHLAVYHQIKAGCQAPDLYPHWTAAFVQDQSAQCLHQYPAPADPAWTGPGLVGFGLADSDYADPGSFDPGLAGPDFVDPGFSGLGLVGPDFDHVGLAGLDASDPGLVAPDLAESGFADLDSFGPDQLGCLVDLP
jgi:hypothetical protein